MSSIVLLQGVTSVSVGTAYGCEQITTASIQASITGTGVLSSTVLIQISNDNIGWVTMATLGLSDTTPSEAFINNLPFSYIRASVSSISGTNATVSVTMKEIFL